MQPKLFRITHVYGLYQALNNNPFYIGITYTPLKRLHSHRRAAAGTRRDSLTGCGVPPEEINMRVLAECDDRCNALMIEEALQKHHGITVVKQERLVPAAA